MVNISSDKQYLLLKKLENQINTFLSNKYSYVTIKEFNINNRDLYLQDLDLKLEDTDDIKLANFILPNGKLKTLLFDLSDFEINELYKNYFDLNNKTINNYIRICHENTKYKGFLMDDMFLSGCFRVGFDDLHKDGFLEYNSTYFKPTTQIFRQIELLCNYSENIYIENTKNSKVYENKVSEPFLFKQVKKIIIEGF